MFRFFLFTVPLALFSGSWALAVYQLPQNLDSSAQRTVAETFGFGTAAKMPGDPLPLGGYDGFQISVNQSFVNVSRLKDQGQGGSQNDFFSSSVLSFGKGIYYDIDTFLFVTPPQNEEYRSYGGLLRARMIDFKDWPLHLGGLLHGSLSQMTNQFGSSVVGADLYVYGDWQNVNFFIGFGQASGTFTFVGGRSGLVSTSGYDPSLGSAPDTKWNIAKNHYWGGFSKHFGRWVASGLSETYVETQFSFSIGYNF